MSHTNPMLAWYPPTILDDVPHLMSLDPALETQADDLTFRDDAGTWWRPQRDASWLRNDTTGWTHADRPESLEGVAPLPIGVPSVHPTTRNEPLDETPVNLDAPNGLARGVELVCNAYRSGAMVSTMAELMLSDWMLLTTDGRLWTVGAQSRSWYAYGIDGWEAQGSAPKGPFDAGAAAPTATEPTDTPAWRWAEHGPYLPETITPAWLVPVPPDGPALPSPAWIATHTAPTEDPDEPEPLQTEVADERIAEIPEGSSGGGRGWRIIGIMILVLVAAWWVLVFVVLVADPSDVGEMIIGSIVLTAIPIGIGIFALKRATGAGSDKSSDPRARQQPMNQESPQARVPNPDGPIEATAPAEAHHVGSQPQTEGSHDESRPEPTASTWVASHVVPVGGLQFWAVPDGTTDPLADLAAGVKLEVIERRADWARVQGSNGWEGWVDGRRLAVHDAGITQTRPQLREPAPIQTPSAESASTSQSTDWLAVAAALTIGASAFLSWNDGFDVLSGFDIPAAYLLTFGVWMGKLSFSALLLVLSVVALGTSLAADLRRYRPFVGAFAVAIGTVYLVRVLAHSVNIFDFDMLLIAGRFLTPAGMLGSWLLVASGVVLLIRR